MNKDYTRRTFIGGMGGMGILGLAALAGCSPNNSGASGSTSAPAQTSASAASTTSGTTASGRRIAIGTLATEDILPFWVARDESMFQSEGLDVDIVQFQSATELIAGVGSGDVDMAMTDIMVAASMFASGIDVQMEWVTLGTSADQGRFGIMVGPDSEIQSLADLAGIPIGVGTNTILEYVMDRLMEAAGVSDGQIVVEELQKLPVRYQAMLSGDVQAAALPGSLLALGEANGCRTVADDSKGDNISQSVMIAQASMREGSGPATLDLLRTIWDKAAKLINENPEAYRSTLVTNANLSDEVADTYPISTYPTCQLPTNDMVDPVLEWMTKKGYLSRTLAYDEDTGTFA